MLLDVISAYNSTYCSSQRFNHNKMSSNSGVVTHTGFDWMMNALKSTGCLCSLRTDETNSADSHTYTTQESSASLPHISLNLPDISLSTDFFYLPNLFCDASLGLLNRRRCSCFHWSMPLGEQLKWRKIRWFLSLHSIPSLSAILQLWNTTFCAICVVELRISDCLKLQYGSFLN